MAPIHPANDLNELSGEEWLYFTKSVWTTTYPSELGHTERKAHGANKPPRLMARLSEFFTRGGELVLDPFAGVGGTLLGAAICRTPHRAHGIELDARWASIYETVVRSALAERDGIGPELADLGARPTRTGAEGSIRRAAGWRWATPWNGWQPCRPPRSTSWRRTRRIIRSSA